MITKLTWGFRGKNQQPLFMLIKEYWDWNEDEEGGYWDVGWAEVLFEIHWPWPTLFWKGKVMNLFRRYVWFPR